MMFMHETEATRAVAEMIKRTPQDDQFKMSLARVMVLLGTHALVEFIGKATTMSLLVGLLENLRDQHCNDCRDQCDLVMRIGKFKAHSPN